MTQGNGENGIMAGLYFESTKSFWHRAPVKTKLFCSFSLLLGLILSANISILVVNTFFLLALAVVPGPGITLLRRLKPFVFFSLFIVLFHSLLNPANTTTWGWLGWEGFLYGSTVALRLVGIVSLAQLFLMTTPPGEVFRFFSSWHKDMGLIMLLLMGFLPVLKEEMTVTMQAQQTRGLHWQTLPERLRAYLTMIIPVIIKALYRAQGMASLLLLRGYGEDQGPSIVQTPFAPAWSKGYYWILFLSTGFFAVNLALLIKSRLQY
jgi:energy-coupling factor transporter transmembrane protein EcfT